MNSGILGAFLGMHHCPFLHICGIYPHDLQNTQLATSSDDKLGLEEDKIAQPFVAEVYWGVHYHFTLVLDGAHHMICHLGQVLDTLQIQ